MIIDRSGTVGYAEKVQTTYIISGDSSIYRLRSAWKYLVRSGMEPRLSARRAR